MSDTQQRGATAAPSTEGTSTERPAISPSAIVAERTEARQREIADLAGGLPQAGSDRADTTTAPKGATAPAPAADEIASVEDFQKHWDGTPAPLRRRIAQAFYDDFNRSIGEQYGDLIPLVVEARNNPQLRAALVEMADPTKDELRQMIADPKVREHAKQFTKAEIRDFLLGDALTTYNKYAVPATDAPPDPNERVRQLEERFETETFARDTQTWIQERGNEVRAVQSAFPHLTPDQLAHVVDVTQTKFENAAIRGGVKTRDDRGNELADWPARAVKAGIRPASFRDYAAQYSEILGRSAPPAAPATSPASMPGVPQAPRDQAEARAAGIRAAAAVRAKTPALQGRSPRR